MKRTIVLLVLIAVLSALFGGCYSKKDIVNDDKGYVATTQATTTTTTTTQTTTQTTTKKTLYYPTVDEFMALFNEQFPGSEYATKSYNAKTNSTTVSVDYNYLKFSYSLWEDDDGRITKCTTTVLGDYSKGKTFEGVFFSESNQVKYYIFAMAVQPSYILACLMSEKAYDKDYFTSKLEDVIEDARGADLLLYNVEFSFSIADNNTCMTGFLNWDGEKQ